MKKINLVEHTINSLNLADQLKSKLPIEVSECPGLSSRKIRHFLNNVCSFEGAKYLNVGLASGSSFWSVIFENNVEAVGCDWFSVTTDKSTEIEFWKCLSNAIRYEKTVSDRNIQIYTKDSRLIDFKTKFNVFFYDIVHTDEEQYNNIIHFDKYMENEYILIVDDYNEVGVKTGLERAMIDLNYKLKLRAELPGIFGYWDVNSDLWWNGLFVGVVEK